MIQVDFGADRAGADALAFLVGKSGVEALVLPGFTDSALQHLKAAARQHRFDGEAGAVLEQAIEVDGSVRRVLLAGVGDATDIDYEKAGGALAARLLTSGETRLMLDLQGAALPTATRNRLLSALVLRAWRFDKYHTTHTEKQKVSLSRLLVLGAPADAAIHWADAAAVIEGVELTRNLVTEPANVIYPESFVARCTALAELGVEITVLDPADMAKLGMGALLGVAQGSVRPARLLVMRWDGTNGAQPAPVAFVGKGVTFDTGGISLKQPGGMEDMKWDMGGAGAVAGAMHALAKRKARAHVVGVCGLVENMPDGNAQRPGDVVTSMSGKTIEVINTDAEGRLVLCDAMTWVQRTYKPEVMIDLATLTGAIITSLGREHGGMFCNDDGLAAQLSAAGAAVGDPLWRMPLGAAYDKLIDSPIADIKNVGPGEAGSITAAQFLQRFVEPKVKWAHLDIAGMVWAIRPGTVWDKGATGYGVRLLDRFIADTVEKAAT